MAEQNYDVVVVGGGPAGLAATCYALQAQLRVALITPDLGGKVRYPFQLRGLPAVETVWGASLTEQFEAYVEAKLGATYPQETSRIARHNDGFELILGDARRITSRAVIVATGAQPQRLYVEGEKEFWGRGVSYSAVSHAQFFRGRSIAVVGGERALPAVLKLAPVASRVYYVLARLGDIEESQLIEKLLRDPRIVLIHDWQVQQIVGDDFVTGLDLVASNGATRTLPVEGVFVEFGLVPNNEMVRGLVCLDYHGHIIVNNRCETNVPGLFAAGDVTNVYSEQVPVATGEGVKAALSAWSYLAQHS